MATNPTIKPRRGTSTPGIGSINQNELAVDTTNKRIYIGAADGSGTLIGAAPGGSDTQIQFNDGGNLGGDSGLTYNKTTDTLTIAGDLAVNGADITTTATGTANIFNSSATTVNIAGAATSLAIGSTTTATQTINIGTGSTGNTFVKTINIGTNGDTGSATAVYIGGGQASDSVYVSNNLYFTVAGDNTIYTSNSSMFAPANMAIYTSGNILNIGGDYTELIVTIGDYDSNNNATYLAVDESNTSVSVNANSGFNVNGFVSIGSTGAEIATTITGTASLFNTSATTLNLGGVSTSITMGATSGTTTTIRGGTLVGNTTTQNLFNTTATTVNAFGAATTVNIGGASTNTVFAGTVEIDGANALKFPDDTIQVTRTPDFLLFDMGII